MKNIIFNISGGVGKNIMATSVISSIKKQYPNSNIVVTTPHTSVWENNPNIDACLNFVENPDFYKNYVKDKNIIFMGNDPYLQKAFIYKKESLIETWSKMFDINYDKSLPKLYFTKEETAAIKEKLPTNKPLFFIQMSGGASNQEYPISWTRDMPMPIAQEVADHMRNKGYEVILLRRDDQYTLENTLHVEMNIREAMCALQFADKILAIDSVVQHAAAAIGKKSVVAWIGNDPKVFGYKEHTNIVSKVKKDFRHKIDSYLDEYNLVGVIHECPYDTNELFDAKEIIKALGE